MSEATKFNVNGDVYDLSDAGAVKFDRAQSLTSAQQSQARSNIGAADASITAAQAELDELKAYVEGMSPVAAVGPTPLVAVKDAAPLEAVDVAVKVKPVQDLNDYSQPWGPGAGKNLFNCPTASSTSSNVTLTPNGDGSFTLEGGASTGASIWFAPLPFDIPAYTSVTFSLNNAATNSQVGVRLISTPDGGSGTSYGSNVLADSANKTGTVSQAFAARGIMVFCVTGHAAVSAITLKIQAELGAEATGWVPYSNVCPLYGRTGMKLLTAGKNLLDPGVASTQNGLTKTVNADGSVSFSGTATDIAYFYMPTYSADHSTYYRLPPGTYKLSSGLTGGTGTGYRINVTVYRDKDNSIKRAYYDTGSGATFTVNANEHAAVYLYVPSGKNMDGITLYPMLQAASDSDETFEGYKGGVTSVSFPSEPGTVYGGTLDVKAGMLTVNMATKQIDDSNSITSVSTVGDYTRFWMYFGSDKKSGAVLCDVLPTTDQSMYTAEAIGICGSNNMYPASAWAKLPTSLVGTTVNSVKAYLQTNPMQVVYELAEPDVYLLTPQEIALFRGNNDIYADAGDTALTYRQDVGLLLDALTRPDEDDMAASTNYAANSFFTIGGTLYRATAAIATGETIVPGTNCAATTVAEQLTYLYSQI